MRGLTKSFNVSVEITDGFDLNLVNLAGVAVQADERRNQRGRRVRVGQKSVGQIADELSPFDRADNLARLVAVLAPCNKQIRRCAFFCCLW